MTERSTGLIELSKRHARRVIAASALITAAAFGFSVAANASPNRTPANTTTTRCKPYPDGVCDTTTTNGGVDRPTTSTTRLGLRTTTSTTISEVTGSTFVGRPAEGGPETTANTPESSVISAPGNTGEHAPTGQIPFTGPGEVAETAAVGFAMVGAGILAIRAIKNK